MKTFEFKPGVPDSVLGKLEASVEAKIRALFARCPTLAGFSVQDRAMLPREVDRNRIPDADLFVTEIGVFPKLESQFDEIYDEITLAISDLVHEQPHAYDFLRGRTFARTLH
jgi:predicted transcriptional regulator YdeE